MSGSRKSFMETKRRDHICITRYHPKENSIKLQRVRGISNNMQKVIRDKHDCLFYGHRVRKHVNLWFLKINTRRLLTMLEHCFFSIKGLRLKTSLIQFRGWCTIRLRKRSVGGTPARWTDDLSRKIAGSD